MVQEVKVQFQCEGSDPDIDVVNDPCKNKETRKYTIWSLDNEYFWLCDDCHAEFINKQY